MERTQYLVAGSSHAGLEAITAIRQHDASGSLTLVTRDTHLPYSPTLLPYIVSGRSAPEQVFLRDERFFREQHVSYLSGHAVARLQPERNCAVLADGRELEYTKALLATGAEPAIPAIPQIDRVHYYVLRTFDDALRLKAAIAGARHAVVLGGGLVGMHAAENLIRAGIKVTVVEVRDRILSGYFDRCAAGLIERAFAMHGARILTGRRVTCLAPAAGGATLLLDDGHRLEADALLIAVGVKPALGYLDGSDIERADGILVDEAMRTNVSNVWAAGDCAQAGNFFGDGTVLNAILPDAAEQGRIAGMAMAGDPGQSRYGGGVPLNTYRFFGCPAISVGLSAAPAGAEERTRIDEAAGRYVRAVFKEGRLLGILGVGEFFDGGVMWQLIRRRVDLSDSFERLLADPLATGREFMSRLWR